MKRSILAGVCILISTANLNAGIDLPLLERTVSGNEAAIDAIATFYAEATVVTTSEEGVGGVSCKYWRDRSRIRFTQTRKPNVFTDFDVRGGKIYSVVTGPGPADPTLASTMIRPLDDWSMAVDPWQAMMFSLPVGLSNGTQKKILHYTLSEGIKRSKVSVVEWVTKPTRQVHLAFELTGEGRRYEVWVDPARNWLVTRCIHEAQFQEQSAGKTKITKWRIESDVADWQETPSISVPTTFVAQSWYNGEKSTHNTISLKNIEINRPVSFPVMPTAPAGTLMVDAFENKVYRLGERGRVIDGGILIGADYSPPMPTVDPIEPILDNIPRPRNRWMWPGILLVVLGVSIYLLRRVRRAKLRVPFDSV